MDDSKLKEIKGNKIRSRFKNTNLIRRDQLKVDYDLFPEREVKSALKSKNKVFVITKDYLTRNDFHLRRLSHSEKVYLQQRERDTYPRKDTSEMNPWQRIRYDYHIMRPKDFYLQLIVQFIACMIIFVILSIVLLTIASLIHINFVWLNTILVIVSLVLSVLFAFTSVSVDTKALKK